MPVSTQTPINTYTGNNSTTVFAYTFRLLAEGDVNVYLDNVLKTLTTHYTVSGVGNEAGGNITFVSAPGTGVEVRFERDVDVNRETDYTEGGALASQTLDDDFDRLVMMIQDLNAKAFQAIDGDDILDANNNRIINVAEPTGTSDAATKNYVDTQVTQVTALDGLTNVTITSNSSGEILKWNGSAWINNTLAEAGISGTSHNHNSTYYTQAQVDAGYSAIGHNHDTSYFTKAQITAGYSPIGHTHNFTVASDADGDTKIQIEESTDEDIIRFDVGSTPTGYVAVPNIMTMASSGWVVSMGTAESETAGAPITFTAGTAGNDANGGDITMNVGPGAGTGSDGQFIVSGPSSGPAELRLEDNGSDYVALKANTDITTSYTLTFPAAVAAGAIRSSSTGALSFMDDGSTYSLYEGTETGTPTVITKAITSGKTAAFEIVATARQDAATESAVFRIFGGVENTSGTAALVGTVTKDTAKDAGAAADWDVTAGVSSGNLTVSLNCDAETVDWKVRVKTMEL